MTIGLPALLAVGSGPQDASALRLDCRATADSEAGGGAVTFASGRATRMFGEAKNDVDPERAAA